jgi:hypothetical protein
MDAESLRAGLVVARRFLRACACDDHAAVAGLLHPTPLAAWRGILGDAASAVREGTLHLAADECATLADEFAQRMISVDLPPAPEGAPDSGFIVWLLAPDSRRVSLALFLDEGAWRVFPGLPVAFRDDFLTELTMTKIVVTLPPEEA